MYPKSDNWLTYSGDGHIITFAPTGTGKASEPVICNALKHWDQLIVQDIKGEVYAATGELAVPWAKKSMSLTFMMTAWRERPTLLTSPLAAERRPLPLPGASRRN